MYNLIFDGKFEVQYPNEFLEDLRKIQEKHNCAFFGNVKYSNLGDYIDFQEIKDKVDEKNTDTQSGD